MRTPVAVTIAMAAMITSDAAMAATRCSQGDIAGKWFVEFVLAPGNEAPPTCEVEIDATGAVLAFSCLPSGGMYTAFKVAKNCAVTGRGYPSSAKYVFRGYVSADRQQFFGTISIPEFEEPHQGRLHAYRMP